MGYQSTVFDFLSMLSVDSQHVRVVESFETIDVWNGKRNKFDFFSIYMILRSSECQGIRCLE